MYRILFIALFLFASVAVCAQPSKEQLVQDSVIGWWDKNRYDKYVKPTTDPLMKRKISHVDHILEWVKKSYTPVGSLGTWVRAPNGDVAYGVNFSTWNVGYKYLDEEGRFRPIPEEHRDFNIFCNQIPGSWPVNFANKPGKAFYFTWQVDGYSPNKQTKDMRMGSDPRFHPNVYKYITRRNDWDAVYLVPGNKLPFTPVSKGELLQLAEDNLPADDKKSRDNIHQLRQKYAASLNEQAVVRHYQLDALDFDDDIFRIDLFEQSMNAYYPVYKLEPSVLEKCKTSQPQWVVVYFPFVTQSDGNKMLEMYTALTQNINYDYIYNYFFDSAKVKGVAYTPVNPEQLKARLDGYRNRTGKNASIVAGKTSGLPANVLIADDFSREALGARPAGWYFRDYDKLSSLMKVDGQPGQWLRLEYNQIVTSTVVKTLPDNFLLEYDIVTDNFAGMTGGSVILMLAGRKKRADGVQASSSFTLQVTSGRAEALRASHNYRGESRAKTFVMPSTMDYNNQGGESVVAQTVFTDEKRRVRVGVKKEGGLITVFLNGTKSASTDQFRTGHDKPCGDCIFPADVPFSQFEIKSLTQDADKVNVYIGNIKLTKL